MLHLSLNKVFEACNALNLYFSLYMLLFYGKAYIWILPEQFVSQLAVWINEILLVWISSFSVNNKPSSEKNTEENNKPSSVYDILFNTETAHQLLNWFIEHINFNRLL